MSDPVNQAGMPTVVIAHHFVQQVQDESMILGGNFRHFDDSPGRLVSLSRLLIGFDELFERHPPALVGRADPNPDGRHVPFLPLISTELRDACPVLGKIGKLTGLRFPEAMHS